MANRTPEGKLKDRVVKMLKARGIWYYTPTMTGRGRNGIPDVLICHRGCFVAAELKVGSNKPTPLQERELTAIQKNGGWALVVRPDRVHGDQGLEGLLDVIDSMADRSEEASRANYTKYREELAEQATTPEATEEKEK